MTGADLDALQLWRAQPDDVESGPNENPDDENVEMDPDEGLMWPDPEKVEEWWAANVGRQRILAAHYLLRGRGRRCSRRALPRGASSDDDPFSFPQDRTVSARGKISLHSYFSCRP